MPPVEALTNEAGTVVERRSYDAFGARRDPDWSVIVYTVPSDEPGVDRVVLVVPVEGDDEQEADPSHAVESAATVEI